MRKPATPQFVAFTGARIRSTLLQRAVTRVTTDRQAGGDPLEEVADWETRTSNSRTRKGAQPGKSGNKPKRVIWSETGLKLLGHGLRGGGVCADGGGEKFGVCRRRAARSDGSFGQGRWVHFPVFTASRIDPALPLFGGRGHRGPAVISG